MTSAAIAERLRADVDSWSSRLRALDAARVDADRGPGTWTRIEILGHLIDSAANNQQRFVLAPRQPAFVGTTYDQEHWVRVHGYRSRAWLSVVDLWVAYNLHLAHAIAAVPDDRLGTPCTIGNNPPEALEWLMQDYIQHMRHHLAQILDETAAT